MAAKPEKIFLIQEEKIRGFEFAFREPWVWQERFGQRRNLEKDQIEALLGRTDLVFFGDYRRRRNGILRITRFAGSEQAERPENLPKHEDLRPDGYGAAI